MRCSTVSALVMAALIGEAVAGPTHAHLHRRAHQEKDVDWNKIDWANLPIDWKSAYEAGQKTTAPPAAAATPPPAPANAAAAAPQVVETPKVEAPKPAAAGAPSSSITPYITPDDKSDEASGLWRGLVGAANNNKEFGEPVAPQGVMGDHYMGNYGNPYASNMMFVPSTEGYDFTNTVINTSNTSMTIVVWNNVGEDGRVLSGSSLAPKKAALTFFLKPGESKIIAFQDNTQGALAEACDEFAESGAFACVWCEFQYRRDGSGYNYSAIMSKKRNNYDMTITSEENTCKSSRTENFWLAEFTPIGLSDGSCFVPGSTARLTTKMGGAIS